MRRQLRLGGAQLLAGFGRRGAGGQQDLLASDVAAVLVDVGVGRLGGGARGVDVGALQRLLGLQGLDLLHCGAEVGLGQGRRGPIIIIDDQGDQVARAHPLEILGRDGADIAGDLGGDRRQVGLQVGVIGGLPSRRPLPAVPAGHDDQQDHEGYDEDERSPGHLRRQAPVDPVPSPVCRSVAHPSLASR